VLKRFGPGNRAPLSSRNRVGRSRPTYRRVSLSWPGLDQLDALISAEGGRLYLAKDSRQSPTNFARTYPRLDEWREIRDTMDPKRVFASDLSRRLEI